jgi:hypothetical protein
MSEIKNETEIAYFEDAVKESDEIIADCSSELQAELTEQKGHFVVALAALREKAARENPQPLSQEQLRERVGLPIWIDIKDSSKIRGQRFWFLSVGIKPGALADYDFLTGYGPQGSWHLPLNEYGNTWLAYDYPPKEAAR